MSVVTGKPGLRLDPGKDLHSLLQARPAIARNRGPVRLVVRRLEDQGHGQPLADLDQARCDSHGQISGLHHARAGDQGQGLVLADLDPPDGHRVGNRIDHARAPFLRWHAVARDRALRFAAVQCGTPRVLGRCAGF